MILATPEYHGSVSGLLKNALDLMSFDELTGKVTGLISVLGGQANSNALNDLRVILRWVHAWVIPEQIAIGQAWQAFNKEGKFLRSYAYPATPNNEFPACQDFGGRIDTTSG